MAVAAMGSREGALPGLLNGGSHVVEEHENTGAAGERDEPACDQGDEVDGT